MVANFIYIFYVLLKHILKQCILRLIFVSGNKTGKTSVSFSHVLAVSSNCSFVAFLTLNPFLAEDKIFQIFSYFCFIAGLLFRQFKNPCCQTTPLYGTCLLRCPPWLHLHSVSHNELSLYLLSSCQTLFHIYLLHFSFHLCFKKPD